MNDSIEIFMCIQIRDMSSIRHFVWMVSYTWIDGRIEYLTDLFSATWPIFQLLLGSHMKCSGQFIFPWEKKLTTNRAVGISLLIHHETLAKIKLQEFLKESLSSSSFVDCQNFHFFVRVCSWISTVGRQTWLVFGLRNPFELSYDITPFKNIRRSPKTRNTKVPSLLCVYFFF